MEVFQPPMVIEEDEIDSFYKVDWDEFTDFLIPTSIKEHMNELWLWIHEFTETTIRLILWALDEADSLVEFKYRDYAGRIYLKHVLTSLSVTSVTRFLDDENNVLAVNVVTPDEFIDYVNWTGSE